MALHGPVNSPVMATFANVFEMAVDDFYIPGALNLMPLDSPLLRVSRPVAACSRCRAAKIKCDGKLPVLALLHTFLRPSTDCSM